MIHQLRVIFGDTDQMGVVYYGNYLRFFEASRAALLRALGRSQRDLEAWGMALPVIEARCVYKQPAHYEDLLDIHVDIAEVRGASMRFDYRVMREADFLAEGYTRHAVIDTTSGRARAMPHEFRALVDKAVNMPRDLYIS